jgi:hypothetical protein
MVVGSRKILSLSQNKVKKYVKSVECKADIQKEQIARLLEEIRAIIDFLLIFLSQISDFFFLNQHNHFPLSN